MFTFWSVYIDISGGHPVGKVFVVLFIVVTWVRMCVFMRIWYVVHSKLRFMGGLEGVLWVEGTRNLEELKWVCCGIDRSGNYTKHFFKLNFWYYLKQLFRVIKWSTKSSSVYLSVVLLIVIRWAKVDFSQPLRLRTTFILSLLADFYVRFFYFGVTDSLLTLLPVSNYHFNNAFIHLFICVVRDANFYLFVLLCFYVNLFKYNKFMF